MLSHMGAERKLCKRELRVNTSGLSPMETSIFKPHDQLILILTARNKTEVCY